MDEKIDQRDVARYLGVTTRTVRNLIKSGALPPPIRIGRTQFWLKDKFTRWLNADGAAAVLPRSAGNPARRPIVRLGKPRLPVA